MARLRHGSTLFPYTTLFRSYGFLRNSALDARNFFDKANPAPFRRGQFGGTLGGPISRDRMFFFVNYEGLRQAFGETRRSEEHTSELQSHSDLVCRLLL